MIKVAAINYCFNLLKPRKVPLQIYSRFSATRIKYMKGKAGEKAIQSMFDYFGIRDKSKYLIVGKEVSLKKALEYCFNKISASTMSYRDHNRFSATKRRHKKGELGIEAITALFDYFDIQKIDNYKLPTLEKQKEYNDFYRIIKSKRNKKAKVIPVRPFEIKYSLDDGKTVQYFSNLRSLCRENNFPYQRIAKYIKKDVTIKWFPSGFSPDDYGFIITDVRAINQGDKES